VWTIEGKTCLITGGTSGIGKETARALAAMGAHVVIVGRDRTKTDATLEELRRTTGNAQVDGLVADLSLMADVRRLADEFRSRYPALHVLINNAGAVFDVRAVTSEGLERTFALNHMSYFVLTSALLDMLKASAPARIVSVSSGAHATGRLREHDLNYEKGLWFWGWLAYGDTKLYNILFTYELARRLKPDGARVTANVLHPGFVRSGFGASRQQKYSLTGIFYDVARRYGMSAERGADTSVHLASSPDVEGISGTYWTLKRPVRSSPASYDETTQAKLWALSAQIAAGRPPSSL
jgi:NAD(P)-dependent dehydrogenase (short-subunit alcohol dehydrogenase family)